VTPRRQTSPRAASGGFYPLAALALAVLAFAMSALVSRGVFERLPHLEDELAYLFQARAFASGQITAELPLPFSPYWQPFVVQSSDGLRPEGGRAGKYPPGWPALLALGVGLGAAWWVNAACAALAVALTYRLGREIFGADIGLSAAALTAFSPMALLLNGTLMSHTSALLFTTAFFYATWKLLSGPPRRRVAWGLAAGVALGLVAINRPLTALAVALPFALFHALRLLRPLLARELRICWRVLRPLMALSAAALAIASAIPLFNWAVTGDPTRNLYLLVWEYDRIGFGPAGEYGPNGHSPLKGVQFARYDLSLTAADLFGWQVGLAFAPETDAQRRQVADAATCNAYAPMRPQVHLRTCSGYWRGLGLSWVLLPLGLLVGFRRRWALAWLLAGVAWLALAEMVVLAALADPASPLLTLWLVYGLFWALAPLAFVAIERADDPRPAWTWLLFGVIFSLIVCHFAYWVGSQRYSTRYYFEALTAAALLSALPLGWLIARLRIAGWRRGPALVYAALGLICAWGYITYSVPRIDALRGFNRVSGEFLAAIESRRQTEKPLLVLATGERPVRWRATGALMAQTYPALEGEIVVAWDDTLNPDTRQAILDRFPDREVIELRVREEDAWFADTCPPGALPPLCPVINP
jgi:4-amino-4-deoxy-L-arabinose transferase-like glycosyltransferase